MASLFPNLLHQLKIECSEDLDPNAQREWRDFLYAAQHQHPRQDPSFAAVERADGRYVLYVTGRDTSGALRAVGLFSLRRFPILKNVFVFATCLSGPVCDDPEMLVAFLEGVCALPAFARVGRIRATPLWTDDEIDPLEKAFAAKGWSLDEVYPVRRTGWVDLTRSPEEILAGFSKSARRELRRAQRQGITVRQLTQRAEAEEFLASLNKLRAGRGLATLPLPGYLTAFETMFAGGDIGVIFAAFLDAKFVSGLQLYRSRNTAFGRHFTLEPERLHALSNLRIAPLVWFEGLMWAKSHGCSALDLEGWRVDVPENDHHFGIHKYKGEFAPKAVRRIAQRGKTNSWFADAASNAFRGMRRLRGFARDAANRLKGKAV